MDLFSAFLEETVLFISLLSFFLRGPVVLENMEEKERHTKHQQKGTLKRWFQFYQSATRETPWQSLSNVKTSAP